MEGRCSEPGKGKAMRWLIINADDFGLCEAANEAVERLFDAGAITTTTLMTPAPFAEDGIRRAKSNPGMKVGVHITTTAEYETYRWGALDQSCRSLMDADGYFYRTAKENLAHALREEMIKEINAQFDWMTARGVRPEHADSHMATVYGLFGFSLMKEVLEICSGQGIHFRYPKRPETFSGELPETVRKTVEENVQLANELHVGLPEGLYTYDFDVKPQDSYEFFRGEYMKMVRSIPEGVSELFMHPCIETDQLRSINRQWKKRVWEYQVLQDPIFRTCIEEEGIRLTSYSEAPFFRNKGAAEAGNPFGE